MRPKLGNSVGLIKFKRKKNNPGNKTIKGKNHRDRNFIQVNADDKICWFGAYYIL